MKFPEFDYLRVDSLSDALAAYEAADGEGIYLAGGHSVMPSLALRLQAPAVLIDIAHIEELKGVSIQDDWLRIGALTRHVEIAEHPLIRQHAPILAQAAPYVAHPAIRNRGTIGGNLALSDPASEFPAVIRALRARLEIVGPTGVRYVEADDYFIDLYTTVIEPGEILRSILVPPQQENSVYAFDELVRRRGDYAMVGLAIQGIYEQKKVNDISIVFCSVGNIPMRAVTVEKHLVGSGLDEEHISSALGLLGEDIDPADDPHLPADVRLHMARVLLGRLLRRIKNLSDMTVEVAA
ncbi:xanthine dehydrogenase family protein subunit M [Paenochrobactrum glaciei]|uniref:Xanthine dehydrogenase family protein subunit M n=1 Tax=Paenochrobactrum glaciei TaxID=486407 RepID=A0ABN1GIZ5_9HYPH